MGRDANSVPIDQTLEVIERDVLPSLASLLGSVADGRFAKADAGFETRSEELRELNRQIIELTQFLAAVTARSVPQAEPNISA